MELCNKWEGKPSETQEMKPKWFNRDKIPYKKMWEDDSYWLPEVLKGRKIKGSFIYTNDEQIITYSIADF